MLVEQKRKRAEQALKENIAFYKKQYSEILSPVTLIASTILTYILAEELGGNGVLAVTTLGLFFGNVYIKRKLTPFIIKKM